MRWAPLPSARLLPIVSRGAYRDTGYHSSVANSTPGTVAGIGSACAQAALIYLPPPFPILSLRHTDSVPADILLSQPMLPNPLSRDQIAYRHRLPRITNDARTPLRRARGSFSGPVPPRWPPLSLLGSLGYWTTRGHCCVRPGRRVCMIISLWRCT